MQRTARKIPGTYFNYDTNVKYYNIINAFKFYFRKMDMQNVNAMEYYSPIKKA